MRLPTIDFGVLKWLAREASLLPLAFSINPAFCVGFPYIFRLPPHCPTAEPSSKQKVLEALSRKFTMDADVDLAAVAEACPPQFTGADMYALCSDAWMTAFKQHISQLGGLPAGGNGNASAIMVRQADFLQAATTLQPSLGEDEIAKYEALRDQYEGGAARH